MNRFFFHLASKDNTIWDEKGRDFTDLAAAHRHAMLLIHKMVSLDDVDSIEPNGCAPGLVAFRCAGYGSTASILVHPVSRRREMNHMHQREQFDYLNSPVSELR
jgi:hypothetical protein